MSKHSDKGGKLRAKANAKGTTQSERAALRRAARRQDSLHRQEQAKASGSGWATNYGPPI